MYKPLWARQAFSYVRRAGRSVTGRNPLSMPASDRTWLLSQLPVGEPGAEIGVWQGDFSVQLLDEVGPTVLHLVDPWQAATDRAHRGSPYSRVSQRAMDRMYESVLDRFDERIRDGRVIVHRQASVDALDAVEDESLGWVYIDGDHSYEAVAADLAGWSTKLKAGGVLAGDDYLNGSWFGDGVIRGVNEFVDSRGATLEVVNQQFVIRA